MLHHSRYTLSLYCSHTHTHTHIYVCHVKTIILTSKLNHVVLHVLQTWSHFPLLFHHEYTHIMYIYNRKFLKYPKLLYHNY